MSDKKNALEQLYEQFKSITAKPTVEDRSDYGDVEQFDAMGMPITPEKQASDRAMFQGINALGQVPSSVTGAPLKAGVSAAIDGQNPLTAAANQFGMSTEYAPTGEHIANQVGINGNVAKLAGLGIDVGADVLGTKGLSSALGIAADIAKSPMVANEVGAVGPGVSGLVDMHGNPIPKTELPNEISIPHDEMSAKGLQIEKTPELKTGDFIPEEKGLQLESNSGQAIEGASAGKILPQQSDQLGQKMLDQILKDSENQKFEVDAPKMSADEQKLQEFLNAKKDEPFLENIDQSKLPEGSSIDLKPKNKAQLAALLGAGAGAAYIGSGIDNGVKGPATQMVNKPAGMADSLVTRSGDNMSPKEELTGGAEQGSDEPSLTDGQKPTFNVDNVKEMKQHYSDAISTVQQSNELSEAQKQVATNNLITEMQRNLYLISTGLSRAKNGITGAKLDPNVVGVINDNAKNNNQPIDFYKQKVEDKQNDPNSPMSKFYRDTIQEKLGIKVPANSSASDLIKAFPVLEKLISKEEASKDRALKMKELSSQKEIAMADKQDQKTREFTMKVSDKMMKAFNGARAGDVAKDAATISAGKKVEAAIGKIQDLNQVPTIMVPEILAAVDNMINATSTVAGKEHLYDAATTLKSKIQSVKARLTGNVLPADLGQQIGMFLKAAKREDALAKDKLTAYFNTIAETNLSKRDAEKHPELKQIVDDQVNSMVNMMAAGVQPEQTSSIKMVESGDGRKFLVDTATGTTLKEIK